MRVVEDTVLMRVERRLYTIVSKGLGMFADKVKVMGFHKELVVVRDDLSMKRTST